MTDFQNIGKVLKVLSGFNKTNSFRSINDKIKNGIKPTAANLWLSRNISVKTPYDNGPTTDEAFTKNPKHRNTQPVAFLVPDKRLRLAQHFGRHLNLNQLILRLC